MLAPAVPRPVAIAAKPVCVLDAPARGITSGPPRLTSVPRITVTVWKRAKDAAPAGRGTPAGASRSSRATPANSTANVAAVATSSPTIAPCAPPTA